MTREEARERLNAIFRDVFDDNSITVTDGLTAEDIEDWDSVTHLTLITEIESKFKMRFKMKEITGMPDAGALLTIITERGK